MSDYIDWGQLYFLAAVRKLQSLPLKSTSREERYARRCFREQHQMKARACLIDVYSILRLDFVPTDNATPPPTPIKHVYGSKPPFQRRWAPIPDPEEPMWD